jgi:hypothetical protein
MKYHLLYGLAVIYATGYQSLNWLSTNFIFSNVVRAFKTHTLAICEFIFTTTKQICEVV